MNDISLFFTQTPWYVYLILIYLIFIGVKAIKGSITPIAKFWILPAIFVWMSIDELTGNLHLGVGSWVIWLLGLALGSVFGWFQFKPLVTSVDREKKLFEVKGSYSALILIIVTFCVKYYIAYRVSDHQAIGDILLTTLLFLSGVFTGAFVGRLLYVLYFLKHGPHVALSEK